MRAGLSALGALSPALASRAGVRLFVSPPRVPAPARERDALARWERTRIATRHGPVAAWRRGLGPAVLLVHGWGGRGGQLAPLGEALAAAGCAPVLFDAPAHGATRGRVASVVHFADAAEDVARAVHARAAVGHSVGGAALAFAASRGLPLDAAVVLGAPRSPAGFLRDFGDALGLAAPLRARIRRRIEAWVGLDMDELDVARRGPRLADAAPLLVVHDRADAEVPHGDGEAYAAAWPGARLLSTEGLGHRRLLRDRAVIAAAVEFVVDRLPRCACGRLAAGPARRGEGRCLGCALADDLWSRERRRERTRRAG